MGGAVGRDMAKERGEDGGGLEGRERWGVREETWTRFLDVKRKLDEIS